MEPMDRSLPTYLVRPYLDTLEQLGRTLLQGYPHKKMYRAEGITALVVLYNEPLAYESVNSIIPFVDEVVVVDASDEVSSLPYNTKIQYVRCPPEQNTQVKIGLLLSRYRWILRWDGDFSPASELPQFLQMTTTKLSGYWQIKGMVRNINNQNHPVLLQKESYLFTYHPAILTAELFWTKKLTDRIALFRGGLPGRICYGTLPPFFRMVNTDMVYANHHFECKSEYRLLERKYQAQWSLLTDAQRQEYTGFKEYVLLQSSGGG